MTEHWEFSHQKAADAVWTKGLRPIFEYRDLGVEQATKGDYIAHIIRAKDHDGRSEVQDWHIHECTFQMVVVLKGWAEFEYEGQGVRRIEAGDCILQRPMIKHRELGCSADFEVLEIVAPADFATRLVEAPEPAIAAD